MDTINKFDKKMLEIQTALLDSAVFRSTSTGTDLFANGSLIESFANVNSLIYYLQYFSPVSVYTFNRVK